MPILARREDVDGAPRAHACVVVGFRRSGRFVAAMCVGVSSRARAHRVVRRIYDAPCGGPMDDNKIGEVCRIGARGTNARDGTPASGGLGQLCNRFRFARVSSVTSRRKRERGVVTARRLEGWRLRRTQATLASVCRTNTSSGPKSTCKAMMGHQASSSAASTRDPDRAHACRPAPVRGGRARRAPRGAWAGP